MKYRKKPVVIEAHLFTAETRPLVLDWMKQHGVDALCNGFDIVIPTLEGDMIAKKGDFIIKGVKGEFYPCRADIFAATYEAVEEPHQPTTT